MPTTRPRASSAGPVAHQSTDMGRRIATRRAELGLTREEVAARCGAAPSYIRYVEEHASAPGIGAIIRLADALETTVADLAGGSAGRPPGAASAPRNARLVDLDRDESWELLAGHGVGRIGVTTDEGPAIVPVNYVVAGGAIAFRTAPGAVPSAAAGSEVAFEVDRIDDAQCQGWSVLVTGRAKPVTAPDAIGRLEAAAQSLPWAGGQRGLWLAIAPERVTGRRVINPQSGVPDPGHGVSGSREPSRRRP
ncbi:helix-turn-helix domain-containing protein [Streptomyces sp. MUM 178J]|uniref:helix-turn-helix domain-containing protein n=1 Tax=Streptomyces sp. MUM 178J TaxID=2791991 RepID=UPI001F0477F2|nr:pyridoxamine 5'-phosphate oxidase family protein [Streptomyces sp. MUM 178J]WRQ79876.1 pyridoxamine 5'-phosphate oxidase family protein [Streptomyces sp. MUM 178J]